MNIFDDKLFYILSESVVMIKLHSLLFQLPASLKPLIRRDLVHCGLIFDWTSLTLVRSFKRPREVNQFFITLCSP